MFGTVTAMHQHRRRFHMPAAVGDVVVRQKKEYCCDVDGCNKSFDKRHQLKQHSYEHTGVLPFECDKCEKRFRTQAHRVRHAKVHNGYTCETCGEVSSTWSELRTHISRMHPKQHKCASCGFICMRKSNYEEHVKTHGEERDVFKCTECERTYTKKSALLKHQQVFHLGEMRHECSVCHKKFAHKKSLQTHELVHQPGYVKPPVKLRVKPASRKRKLDEKDLILRKLTGFHAKSVAV